MHELSIVSYVMDQVEEVCREQELTQVASVTLEIGEVSGVIFDYLEDLWEWTAGKRPLFQGSCLRQEVIPAVTFCRRCRRTYLTVPQGITCPHCGSGETELLTGNEIIIKEIEGKQDIS